MASPPSRPADDGDDDSGDLPPSNVGTGQESRLDQIIKGSPAVGSKAARVATAYVQTPSIHVAHPDASHGHPPASVPPPNPLDSHPTSPPTIYLNLIILEASLRAQYHRLHLRRRKYTVFLIVLCLWTGYFFNAVYIVGPSPYSIISTFQKLCLLGGIVTGLLFWMSGLYAKTMIWPRRLVGNVNKGLRMFNVKLVVVNRSFSQRMRDWMEIIAKRHPLGWVYSVGLKRVPPPRHIHQHVRGRGHSNASTRSMGSRGTNTLPGTPGTPPPRSAADVALAQRAMTNTRTPVPVPDVFDPDDYLDSGERVKLVILAKHFSADFREGWEIYRSEYWEKENERRALEVQAIKTSLHETGQLPPMNSHGIVVGAAFSSSGGNVTPTGPAFPGISGRPVRKPSISSGTPLRPRAKSSAATAAVSTSTDLDATLRGTSSRGRTRVVRRKSTTLRQHGSTSNIEDLDREKASMDVKLRRPPPTRASGTGSSSTDTMASNDDSSGL
ncbi:hypothetical protein Dda_7901 [Drechslerella dactyloides]|uniref:Spo7-like protein n=1 Tax=Drechslerella dactyloides TaxID=74499 RepID=A0AAD6NHQ8_DREDA|nr:hypothetical protein Dda_7901 [Drechslerella dactyloides]